MYSLFQLTQHASEYSSDCIRPMSINFTAYNTIQDYTKTINFLN